MRSASLGVSGFAPSTAGDVVDGDEDEDDVEDEDEEVG